MSYFETKFRSILPLSESGQILKYLLRFIIEVACYFVEHAPVDPVRMTYSNGYQNARTGVGSVVVVFIRVGVRVRVQ